MKSFVDLYEIQGIALGLYKEFIAERILNTSIEEQL